MSTYDLTLLELRAKHPRLFYAQHWFTGHRFMQTFPNAPFTVPPTGVTKAGQEATPKDALPLAVDLAHAYVKAPHDPIWRQHYFWCRDVDDLGQRIYVGDNGHGLEVHRHLHLTDRFGVPSWS